MDDTTFSSLGLSEPLLRAVAEQGYLEPTPVQRQVIPAILQRRDVRAQAPTGSGKTAAFVLPLLELLHTARPRSPRPARALVVVPTRELATQTGEALRALGALLPERLRTSVLVGGVSQNPQMLALRGGADVVVATPGRLLDLVGQNAVRLDAVQLLVLDEADRLLALGFADELARVLALLPARRQSLLFSSTFPPAVSRLVDELLHEPARIEVASQTAVAGPDIVQRAIEVDEDKRTLLLRHLLQSHDWDRVLVFVASRHGADHVAMKLTRAGVRAVALHGDLSQGARGQALADFKAGRVRVLVATDLASRGLDIVHLPAVVSYDLPRSPADHLHRVGRTGRAGQAGVAIAFVTAQNADHLRLIERRHKLALPRERLTGFEPTAVALLPRDPAGGIKGKRKSKKDKLREAAARERKGKP